MCSMPLGPRILQERPTPALGYFFRTASLVPESLRPSQADEKLVLMLTWRAACIVQRQTSVCASVMQPRGGDCVEPALSCRSRRKRPHDQFASFPSQIRIITVPLLTLRKFHLNYLLGTWVHDAVLSVSGAVVSTVWVHVPSGLDQSLFTGLPESGSATMGNPSLVAATLMAPAVAPDQDSAILLTPTPSPVTQAPHMALRRLP